MSIMDAKLTFCESFSLASISLNSNSNVTNVLDLGAGRDWYDTAKTPDIGNGTPVYLNIICEDEDFASAGSPVVTIDLHASASASMASADTLITTVTDKTPNDGDTILKAAIPLGAVKQYMTVNVATTAVLTAGKITAYLDLGPRNA